MTGTRSYWCGRASLTAGVLWLLIWLHQYATHGPTPTNEMQLRLGFTWMDSGKFLVAPTLLFLIEWIILDRRCDIPGRLGWRIGSVATIVGLGFLSLGIALEFWPFPWGSYALRFEEAALPRIGGVIQALASLVFTVGIMAQSFELVRTRVIPAWVALVLILGAFTTFFLTPVTWIPGASWLVFGWMLSRPRLDND